MEATQIGGAEWVEYLIDVGGEQLVASVKIELDDDSLGDGTPDEDIAAMFMNITVAIDGEEFPLITSSGEDHNRQKLTYTLEFIDRQDHDEAAEALVQELGLDSAEAIEAFGQKLGRSDAKNWGADTILEFVLAEVIKDAQSKYGEAIAHLIEENNQAEADEANDDVLALQKNAPNYWRAIIAENDEDMVLLQSRTRPQEYVTGATMSVDDFDALKSDANRQGMGVDIPTLIAELNGAKSIRRAFGRR